MKKRTMMKRPVQIGVADDAKYPQLCLLAHYSKPSRRSVMMRMPAILSIRSRLVDSRGFVKERQWQ